MNLLDYLATEFAPFDEKPFNPVDSAVLSQFCMVRAEGVVPALRERSSFLDLGTIVENLLSPARSAVRFADALRAELYPSMFTGLDPHRVKENLLALAASPRFRDMRVRDYLSLFDTDRQTQFAAMTFVHRKDFAYVGFRGTDTSFTGWRETCRPSRRAHRSAGTGAAPRRAATWPYTRRSRRRPPYSGASSWCTATTGPASRQARSHPPIGRRSRAASTAPCRRTRSWACSWSRTCRHVW